MHYAFSMNTILIIWCGNEDENEIEAPNDTGHKYSSLPACPGPRRADGTQGQRELRVVLKQLLEESTSL